MLRILGLFYPLVMLLCIVATANHYFLDAAVGALVISLGFLLNPPFGTLLAPFERRFFKLIGVVRPPYSPLPSQEKEDIEMKIVDTTV